jgi:hypothetical protein
MRTLEKKQKPSIEEQRILDQFKDWLVDFEASVNAQTLRFEPLVINDCDLFIAESKAGYRRIVLDRGDLRWPLAGAPWMLKLKAWEAIETSWVRRGV